MGVQKPCDPYQNTSYFGERKIAEIEPKDVIAWQNELLAYKGKMKCIPRLTLKPSMHSYAIFNHAIRYYHLPSNPAQKSRLYGK